MIKESNTQIRVTISKALLSRVREKLNEETSLTNYIVNLIRNDLDKSHENQ